MTGTTTTTTDNPTTPAPPNDNETNMSSCLTTDDPYLSLLLLSSASSTHAQSLSLTLSKTLSSPITPLPPSLHYNHTTHNNKQKNNPKSSSSVAADHPLRTTTACTESIHSSLRKIADGGSKASLEMRALETQREEIEREAADVSNALRLRELAAIAAENLGGQRYSIAAEAMRNWRKLDCSPEALALAGGSCMRQLERSAAALQKEVLEKYGHAVERGDIGGLSDLTPLLGILGLADKGVGLYLKYSQQTLAKMMEEEKESERERQKRILRGEPERQVTICQKLAKVMNAGVTHMRHHLPMLSYALGEADGDAALVQLVHLEVERRVVEMIKTYSDEKKLAELDGQGGKVISRIEERYINGIGLPVEDDDDHNSRVSRDAKKRAVQDNDCGFKAALGGLSELDTALDEAALLLQHTESYERFIRHAVEEVMRARELRYKTKLAKQRAAENNESKDSENNDNTGTPLPETMPKIEILPSHTQFNETVAEFGSHYSSLEHTLLLASMQHAFLNALYATDANYSPVSLSHTTSIANRPPDAPGSRALQTSIVEDCLYAARRSTQRAFATGHAGTACAAANFCADSLGRLLSEVMVRRTEQGTVTIKAVLVGGGGALGMAAMKVMKTAEKGLGMRGKDSMGGGGGVGGVGGVVRGRHQGLDGGGGMMGGGRMMSEQMEIVIGRACAAYNDLEVAMDYTRTLEKQFLDEIDTGFPPGSMTEQLRMCVKSLSPVVESYKISSNRSIDSLVNNILPKVRSIVNDAVGQDATGTSFMGSSVMGGAGAPPTIRMNYNLDDDAYEMLQVSEGYMGRLCLALDELLNPLRVHLIPSLSDALVIGALSAAAKRIEASIRRSHFTALGALALDSDLRQFLSYAKDRLDAPELTSTVALYKTCTPLARLSQIASLMNVDDLEDVLDLITSSKRKGHWDLKLDDAKAFLNLRVDFEGRKVNELLRIEEEV